MAKPRIFISSTYYDLKQTREDLASFLTNIGYEPVRNEEGNIPYGNETTLETYCYREIQHVDIFVSIIGGRFGSPSHDSRWSISNEELRTALKQKKQVYIFIDTQVAAEYETYLLNKGGTTRFKYVDNVKIYEFIEEIKGLASNNNIKEFSTSADIQNYLKEQLAGLFQSFLDQQSRMKDMNLATKLESTAVTLEKLVDYFREDKKGKNEAVAGLLKSTHPIVHKLSTILNINFGFWIEDIKTLDNFLSIQGWSSLSSEDDSVYSNWYVWKKGVMKISTISISKDLFDEQLRLRDIKQNEWQDDFITLTVETREQKNQTTSSINEYDLPF